MSPLPIKLILSNDGSHTLYNEQLNETYHSTHGAVQESLHVFIEQGIVPFFLQRPTSLRVLEVGFGTGLNALLTMGYAAKEKISVTMDSYETFPLPEDIWTKLNYPTRLTTYFDSALSDFEKIHRCNWGETSELCPYFFLKKINASILTLQEVNEYDVIYFDAFAPTKQAEMWEKAIFEKLFVALKKGGSLVSYCAQGNFKRTLKAVGFEVIKLSGPPGKKEMTKAVKL